jgi:hypothetical protein
MAFTLCDIDESHISNIGGTMLPQRFTLLTNTTEKIRVANQKLHQIDGPSTLSDMK